MNPSAFALLPPRASGFCEEALNQEGSTQKENEEIKMKSEIETKLEQFAIKRSYPFCYSCYSRAAQSGVCAKCGTDDCMREYPGHGVEFGTQWIYKAILESELEPISEGDAFEDYMREVYPETTVVGFLNLDTVTTMRDQDPTAWDCAQSEWMDAQLSDEVFFTPDNGTTIYSMSDVEALLEKGGG